MKKLGKGKVIGFCAGLILAAFVMLLLLQMYRNTLFGWIATIVLLVFFCFVHFRYLTEKKWWKRALSWLLVILLFVGIFNFSTPPVKQIDAIKHDGQMLATDKTTTDATDIITVEQGKLTGVYNDDDSVAVYAGIPYAAPPVGDLRWKEPEDPESWDGVRACDTFAPMSMQNYNSAIYDFGSSLIGYHNLKLTTADDYKQARSEDCLYLNVWTPADAKEGDDLPVVVYIHGGSLTTGQSYYGDYNGENYAKNGVIFVSINYRLGIFGYLATEELAAESENGTTGNYGLLDQIKALEWVNKNINAFGGDSENITIAGESAGSSSVNALCVSPLAKGLFEKAIGESSGICGVQPYHTFRTYDEALETGSDIMQEFNCTSMDEMRALSAEELLTTSYSNSSMTVDGYAITEQPYLTYEKGENNEQALLNGYNANEGYVFTMFGNPATADNYDTVYQDTVGDLAADVVKLLPADSNSTAKSQYTKFMGIAWFGYSHYAWSNLVSSQGKDVYLYYFDKENGSIGTWHSGELPYAYGNLDENPGAYDETDQSLSNTMVSYWINFIKTGNPNGDGLKNWEKYEKGTDQIMTFDADYGMKENKDLQLMQIVDEYQESLK